MTSRPTYWSEAKISEDFFYGVGIREKRHRNTVF